MAKNSKVGINELKKFAKRLEDAANRDLKRQYNVWLEAIGMEFLGIVQDQIIRLGVVDTRRLLNSFNRGNGDCVFELNQSNLVLKIGTNIEYAAYVNDGHKLPNDQWWEGYHYFDISITILEKIIAASLERKMVQWLRKL
ncbi:MAG: bacteriophage HK97-gp10, tail-component family protein [Firmicutes bacterium]|nr:bacteriophage HK97-gp10, tail-component family protein [Bacillota bacterium]